MPAALIRAAIDRRERVSDDGGVTRRDMIRALEAGAARAAGWAAMAALLGTSSAMAGGTDAAATRQAVVLEAVENMYSAPDPDKDVVSQALLGQVVGLLETRDGFARIETPDHYTGWVPAGGLFEYPDAQAPRYASRGRVAEVTSLIANLHRAPHATTAR